MAHAMWHSRWAVVWAVTLSLLGGCQRHDLMALTADAATEGNVAKSIEHSEAEWQAKLSPEQYRVCRGKGTEWPFQNAYWNHHGDGVYHCVACGEALFDSKTKFDSGTGWPSFWSPIGRGAVAEGDDKSIAEHPRTELTCCKCGSHLGHVFDDGPRDQTGLRYCVNSTALSFRNRAKAAARPER
ncbi:MAG: peptide-methionine (R)-S-oxide reductase MsrB [Planctomycetaceae bacterium]|nr:peptide-methionine (R)-S-oxide reductase MsrB [Planctomycetaceae bacterium]